MHRKVWSILISLPANFFRSFVVASLRSDFLNLGKNYSDFVNCSSNLTPLVEIRAEGKCTETHTPSLNGLTSQNKEFYIYTFLLDPKATCTNKVVF